MLLACYAIFRTVQRLNVCIPVHILTVLSTPLNHARRSSGGEKRQLSDLVRSNIQDLTPYRCARDDYSDGVLLDANENSYGPSLVAGQVNKPSGWANHSITA